MSVQSAKEPWHDDDDAVYQRVWIDGDTLDALADEISVKAVELGGDNEEHV